jgi:glycine cleavage system H protein
MFSLEAGGLHPTLHGSEVVSGLTLNLVYFSSGPSVRSMIMEIHTNMSTFPTDLRYAETHEWVRLEGETATIGLSAFAVEQLTDLIVIDLAKPGSKVKAGGRLGEVESVKSVNDIYAPIGGEILEVNAAVVADLSKLSNDPYGSGWLVKIKPDNNADFAAMMSADVYSKAVTGSDH